MQLCFYCKYANEVGRVGLKMHRKRRCSIVSLLALQLIAALVVLAEEHGQVSVAIPCRACSDGSA